MEDIDDFLEELSYKLDEKPKKSFVSECCRAPTTKVKKIGHICSWCGKDCKPIRYSEGD